MTLHRISLFAKNVQLLLDESPDANVSDGADDNLDSSSSVQASPRSRLEVAVNEFETIVRPKLRGIASLLRTVEGELSQQASPIGEQVSGNLILVMTELLRKDVVDLVEAVKYRGEKETAKDPVALGHRIVDHVETLHQKISGVARQLDVHFTSNVSEVVATVIQLVQSATADTVIEVQQKSPGVKAITSPADLGGVLSLLINNSLDALARKASASVAGHKKITVRVIGTGDRVRIEVRTTDREWRRVYGTSFSTRDSLRKARGTGTDSRWPRIASANTVGHSRTIRDSRTERASALNSCARDSRPDCRTVRSCHTS